MSEQEKELEKLRHQVRTMESALVDVVEAQKNGCGIVFCECRAEAALESKARLEQIWA